MTFSDTQNTENENLLDKSTLWASVSEEDARIFTLLSKDFDKSEFHSLAVMIAYANYAMQKHEFIEWHKKNHKIPPSNEQLRAIVFSYQNVQSYRLKDLRETSEKRLKEILEDNSKKIARDKIIEPLKSEFHQNTRSLNTLINSKTKSLEDSLKKNGGFWQAVLFGVSANIAYSIFIAVIVFTITVVFPENKVSRAFKILLELEEQVQPKSDN